ncbi:hypothetical protein IFM89_010696 [Coptis chinensis]|uniref:Uncharacterized protein n=1 Tax=Coptis chinensis TaxID=261450 RepID=A0A835ILP7_9MAGN|nr:hypothetical protein IFM89_010696 [Coptis chinensis]
MSSVERYDVEKNEWVEMDGLPRFRAGCVGFLVGNGEEMEFWVMGWYGESRTVSGVFPVDEYYRDGVVLELKSGGKWREIENMWEEGERRRLGNVVVLDGEDGEEPGIFMLDGADIFRLHEAGLIPTLLPLLKDTEPQHLHLVDAVHVLEAFMDYSNPKKADRSETWGLGDTIARLKIEVCYIESGSDKRGEDSHSFGKGKQVVDVEAGNLDMHLFIRWIGCIPPAVTNESFVTCYITWNLCPRSSARLYGSMESLLPHCLLSSSEEQKRFWWWIFVDLPSAFRRCNGVEAPSLATESIGCSAPFQWKPMPRLLETILENLDTYAVYLLIRKGLKALQLFTLPLMPLTFSEIIWQISLAGDSKVEEKMEDREVVTKNATLSVISGNGDDANVVPMVRYMNPVSTRNNSQSEWSAEEEILSVFRSVRSVKLQTVMVDMG